MSSELLSYLGLALAGLGYWAYQNWGGLSAYLFPDKPVVISLPDENWKTDWVQTLMRLQLDLEDAGEEQCVPLVREMIWRLLGGEPNDVQGRARK